MTLDLFRQPVASGETQTVPMYRCKLVRENDLSYEHQLCFNAIATLFEIMRPYFSECPESGAIWIRIRERSGGFEKENCRVPRLIAWNRQFSRVSKTANLLVMCYDSSEDVHACSPLTVENENNGAKDGAWDIALTA